MNNKQQVTAFDPAQVLLKGSNLIEASAGTGKTYSIAILALRLVLEKRIPVQEILMVTFTRAAVAELETRIREFMRSALKVSQGLTTTDETITGIVAAAIQDPKTGPAETERLLKEAVLFLDETSILTIHSFCQRVLTEFAFETRQVFGPEIITDTRAIITDRVNAFWRRHITTMQTGLLQQLVDGGLTRSGIIKMIQHALAGKRLVELSPLPTGFLSADHQAGLYQQLNGFDINIETIKSTIKNLIVSDREAIRMATEKNSHARKNMGHLLDHPEQFLEAIIENSDKAYVQKSYPQILEMLAQADTVEAQKQLALKAVINQVHHLAIRIVTAESDRFKQQNNQLGFDDMINKLHEAVIDDTNDLLIKSLRTKYRAAFIDEFQDTDKLQYEIFDRLFTGDTILFYIGDPKQSIYAWRKADIFTYFKAANAVQNRFGMEVNYRSSPKYIEAMNRFFLPDPGFDTFYFSGEQDAIRYIDVAAPQLSTKGELLLNGVTGPPITIFEEPANEKISETVVAQIIRLLGSDDYRIEKNGVTEKVKPADIGILVRKNKQAATIKRLLCKFGIPAITIDDSKLLQSDEARRILYLLNAVLDIDASSINKALLSPLTGMNPAAILQMDDELALNRFKVYQQLWEKEGIYVMLTRFMAEYKVKQVLQHEAANNGERTLTNVLQLMELLHKIQTQKHLSPVELTSWFKRGIEGMPVEGDEFEQRIESDEDAIKIVTIHKSKGLEYNIVFAPFLDLAADGAFEFLTYRDAESGDYMFSDAALLSDEQLRITTQQQEQENRRLIYVAITRSVYKCYITRSTYSKFNQSALAPFVAAAKAQPSPLIAFEASPELPVRYRYQAAGTEVEPVYRTLKNFRLAEANWRRLSYTYLDAGHTPLPRLVIGRESSPYDEFIYRTLRRGAQTGNLLHFIFERIDFADPVHWEKTIAEAEKRFLYNSDATIGSRLIELVNHVLYTTITIAGMSFSLHALSRDKRLNELEFDFNTPVFDTAQVSRLSTTSSPVRLRFAQELEGMMNGKIDLFFEYGGKYFILDWKSNFLGNRVEDYAEANISAAMTESNYHLQYLIYTLAVTKYLQLRVPGFDYATDFGGVIYLFIRGIRKNGSNGIFVRKPEVSLVNELNGLLSKTSLSGHP